MKDKIVQLMKSEGITSSRLAEILEIQPSGVSHLVSGRNKPGFDLLQKILRRFPKINPYWLMLDDEDMYLPNEATPVQAPLLPIDTNGGKEQKTPLNGDDLFSRASDSNTPPRLGEGSNEDLNNITSILSSSIEPNAPRLKRVILLYNDGSCESYTVN